MRIGIIGCGQLARMLALAGLPLGLKFSFVADTGSDTDLSCVEGLGLIAPWQAGDNLADLYDALGQPDAFTVEKEQVDLNLLQGLAAFCRIAPSVNSVAHCKSRIEEKQLLAQLQIPSAPFCYGIDLNQSAKEIGLPMVLKSLHDGYDGKNQWLVKDDRQLAQLAASPPQTDYLAEQWIAFDREVSLIGVRSTTGETQFYPLTENVHHQGILVRSIAPAQGITPMMQQTAEDYMRAIFDDLAYVGVLAMELFVVGDKLLVNELAPRVHNSGHWTQLGAMTCQFENHLRAIVGLPLGATQAQGATAMLNLLGTAAAPREALTANASLHWYNKTPQPQRKVGHININACDHAQLQQQIAQVEARLSR